MAEQRARDLERVIYDTRRGLAVLGQGPAGELPVRFARPFAQAAFGDIEINGSRPTARVRQVDAGGLVRGAELVVDGTRYRVVSVQPSDAGEVELELEVLP